MTEREKTFLQYHEEHPGRIEPRRVIVEGCGFTSSHARSTELCHSCGQDREVVTTSYLLIIWPKGEDDYFLVEEDVWKAAGAKKSFVPGIEIEVDIELEKLKPNGFQERVANMRVVG